MDITKSIGAFVIAVLVGFSSYMVGHQTAPAPQEGQKAGSITSPDLPYNYIGVGGIENYTYQMALTAATTTPCAFISPAATTTLEVFTMNITTGTSTAGLVTVATSTTAFATTSLVTTKTLIASQPGTVNWHPGVDNAVVAPSTYVVAGVANAPTPGFTLVGTCSATFRTVN